MTIVEIMIAILMIAIVLILAIAYLPCTIIVIVICSVLFVTSKLVNYIRHKQNKYYDKQKSNRYLISLNNAAIKNYKSLIYMINHKHGVEDIKNINAEIKSLSTEEEKNIIEYRERINELEQDNKILKEENDNYDELRMSEKR